MALMCAVETRDNPSRGKSSGVDLQYQTICDHSPALSILVSIAAPSASQTTTISIIMYALSLVYTRLYSIKHDSSNITKYIRSAAYLDSGFAPKAP